MQTPFYTLQEYLCAKFPYKVQKISIDAGFTCPNRDGSKGNGGCTYCNNETFSPVYCSPKESITEQLEEGKRFFARKYPEMRYIAYFQSYTNTYGALPHLKTLYQEALAVEGVVGIAIGTRPDCVSQELLNYLTLLSKKYYVMVEYGVESTDEETLVHINRGHTYTESVRAIEATAKRGIAVCAHLIIGLPGEDRAMIIQHAQRLSLLPLTTVKLHQLQLIRGTKMAAEAGDRFNLFTPEEYIDAVIDFVEHLRPEIVVERFVSQSPAHLLIAPQWGIKNHVFVDRLVAEMRRRNTFQGRLYRD